MAVPLMSGPAPAALIDRDQMLFVELGEGDPELVALVREAEDAEIGAGMVAAGRGRKGTKAEYRCAGCGYGIVVHYGQPAGCPMCSERRWEHVEWRPFSQLPDFAFGTHSQRRQGADRRVGLVRHPTGPLCSPEATRTKEAPDVRTAVRPVP